MRVTLCDVRDATGTKKGEPCGDRATVEVNLRWNDENWVIDCCDVHAKGLTANARKAEVEPSPYKVTKLPRADASGRKAPEQLVEKIDYPDLRNWAEAQGLLPQGSRGMIKREIQERWIAEGEPRPV